MLNLSELFRNKAFGGIIRLIDELPVEFFLTGSKFFGGEHAESDWDFFVQYSDILEKELIKIGFTETSNYKTFTGINKVYQYEMFHIQLIENAAEKRIIQKIIKETIPMQTLNHGQRKMIWHLAYKCFREGNQENIITLACRNET